MEQPAVIAEDKWLQGLRTFDGREQLLEWAFEYLQVKMHLYEIPRVNRGRITELLELLKNCPSHQPSSQLVQKELDRISSYKAEVWPKLPMKFVEADGKPAFRLTDVPELIIRADVSGIVTLYVDGEPMGTMQSIEFKASHDTLIPKAKVRLISYSEDTKKRIETMRKIPWLEVEEVPESEWSKW
jgi:hypothetical protein